MDGWIPSNAVRNTLVLTSFAAEIPPLLIIIFVYNKPLMMTDSVVDMLVQESVLQLKQETD